MAISEVFPIFESLSKNKVPVIYQAEQSECGLACLAMISSYHGYKVSIAILRQRFSISSKGTTFENICNIASRLGLSARAVKFEINAIRKLNPPLILHWHMDHFVVLEKVLGNTISIVDPAVGRKTFPIEEALNYITGVAIEIIPTSDLMPEELIVRPKISQFWGRVKGLKSGILNIILLSVILQVFILIGPLYNQMAIDSAITKGDSSFLSVVVVGLVVFAIIRITTISLRSFSSMYLSRMLSYQMSVNLFRHLIRLPVDYFEKRHVGDISTRFGSLKPIQSLLTSDIASVVLDGFMAITTLIVMFIYNYELTLISISVLLGYFLVYWWIFPHIKHLQEKAIHFSGEEHSLFLESLRASKIFKAFGKEQQRQELWQTSKAETINAQIELQRFSIYFSIFKKMVFSLLTIYIFYKCASFVINNTFSLGMMFAFQSYHGQCIASIKALIDKAIKFRMLGLHLDRLADIVSTSPEIHHQDSIDINPLTMKNCIQLDNVSFSYSQDDGYIFENVCLRVRRGETVCIVGPSGEGKTTLINIILGLNKPNKGFLKVDNSNISDTNLWNFRQIVGSVSQDDKLLSGSILDNITFFDSSPKMNIVEEVAKLANIDEQIQKMPMKYMTLIGDMGSSLSGGQQQRIMLARALYRKPSILVLDEGTANLDKNNENAIINKLQSLDVTKIYVAHRPEMIMKSDRIIEVKNGKVVEITKSQWLTSYGSN